MLSFLPPWIKGSVAFIALCANTVLLAPAVVVLMLILKAVVAAVAAVADLEHLHFLLMVQTATP